jgi:hypothetical protein
MAQALHILKKDIRCFRIHILVVIVSAIVSVRAGLVMVDGVELPAALRGLLWLTGTLLISMVVHAESIPGNRVYWLTRPYRWKSLLVAKLLFCFLFVSLPPAIVMFVFLELAGFSMSAFLPSLVLWEAMIFLVWVLPVAALSAVTESLAAFFVGLVFIGATSAALSALLCCSPNQYFPPAVAWVPPSIVALVLMCGAVAVLYTQYRTRTTLKGWLIVGSCVVLTVLVGSSLPFALGMNVQSLVSRSSVDHSSMSVSMHNELFKDDSGTGFHLDVAGLPAGFAPHPDAMEGEIVDRDGNVVEFSFRRLLAVKKSPAGAMRVNAYLPSEDVAKLKGKSVTVRGSVYLTLFTPTRVWEQGAPTAPEFVAEGVRCEKGPKGWVAKTLSCRAMMGFPRGRLEIEPRFPPNTMKLSSDSYWPFASLEFVPYEEWFIPLQLPSSKMTFRYTEPVSHFRLDFDFPVERFLQ